MRRSRIIALYLVVLSGGVAASAFAMTRMDEQHARQAVLERLHIAPVDNNTLLAQAQPNVQVAPAKEPTTKIAVAPVQKSLVPSQPRQIKNEPQKKAVEKPSAQDTKPVTRTQKNWLVIPKMGVNTEILEGKTEAVLNKGIWHLPGTANPAIGGNFVVSGHRYKWLPPSTKTFWDIDKMEVGDKIYVTWEGQDYTYVVTSTRIVEPEAVEILHHTEQPQITLFSCTPKFTSTSRLVVQAAPIGSAT